MADIRKSLKIEAMIDTSGIDTAIDKLKRQFEDVSKSFNNNSTQASTAARLSQQGFGGILSVPKVDDIQKSKRAMDQFIREQAQALEKNARAAERERDNLEKLNRIKKESLKNEQEALKLEQAKVASAERLNDIESEREQRSKRLNQAMDIRSGGVPKAGMSPLQIGGAVLGGVGTALSFGASAYEQLARSPFRTQINTGGAMQGTIGRGMEDMRSVYGQSWMAERMRAAGMANTQDQITRRADMLRLAGGTAMMGGGAALFGAGLAGTGTGVGALGGIPAMLSGGASMAGGANMVFGDERRRALASSMLLTGAGNGINNSNAGKLTGGMFGLGDYLKGQGSQQMKEYNAANAKEFAENFQKALSSEQQINPLKDLAAKVYDQNFMQYLQSQRGMGLSYEGFHGAGGFRQRAMNSGFTEDMGMGMSNDILSAGGSSRMARESVFGLQMQRGLNMTNAGGILGKLSGGLGSAESSQAAAIKILSEGVRLGLDDSKFAEENRRFTQITADIIGRKGSISENDAERIAGRFGDFVAEKTNVGMEGAKGAYERYQEMSSATTGPRGVMRASAFMSDDKINQLPTLEKQALLSMREEDINENNLTAVSIASKLGISVDELASRVGKANKSGVSRFKGHDEAIGRLKKAGVTGSMLGGGAAGFQQMSPEVQKDIGTATTALQVENPGMSPVELKAMLSGELGGPSSDIEKSERERLTKRRMEGTETGKVEDQSVQNLAESGKLALDSFQQLHKEMIPTVTTIQNFNAALKMAIEGAKNMSPDNQGKFNSFIMGLFNPGANNQPQAKPESK